MFNHITVDKEITNRIARKFYRFHYYRSITKIREL